MDSLHQFGLTNAKKLKKLKINKLLEASTQNIREITSRFSILERILIKKMATDNLTCKTK
jgi:hypothetical protein